LNIASLGKMVRDYLIDAMRLAYERSTILAITDPGPKLIMVKLQTHEHRTISMHQGPPRPLQIKANAHEKL
jgi:hypothetical protein